MELVSKLQGLQNMGKPVRVGIVGCGQMGTGMAHAVNRITGMRIDCLADINVELAIKAFKSMGYTDIVAVDSVAKAQKALEAGSKVVTDNAMILVELDNIDANVDVTGVTDIGAKLAYNSIMNRKPIIMLNVETDITVGYYLNQLARKMNTVYTVASGDEPGVCKMLYEQARLMGFEVVTLGKGKNNVIDYAASKDTPYILEEAAGKAMSPKMLAAFKDGTKTMVEMCAVANATGMVPDVEGMHGAKVEIEDLASKFIPREDGGILSQRGVVDYSTGKVAPGVFAIVYTDDKKMRADMKFMSGKEGPYYLQYRPYHLCNIETPQSIAEAVVLGERTITASEVHADVVCKAKRDLKAGQKLSDIGGSDWYGVIIRHEDQRQQNYLPIGIASNAVLKTDIKMGENIKLDQVAVNSDSFVYKLYELQKEML